MFVAGLLSSVCGTVDKWLMFVVRLVNLVFVAGLMSVMFVARFLSWVFVVGLFGVCCLMHVW